MLRLTLKRERRVVSGRRVRRQHISFPSRLKELGLGAVDLMCSERVANALRGAKAQQLDI